SINGKRYVLLIIDDYSKYTWTHLLRSKFETPEVLIDFPRLVQRGLHAQMASDHVSSDPGPECQRMALEHDSLSLDPQFVSKSSTVTTADAPNQRQQQPTTPLNNQITPDPTRQVSTQAPTVASTENMNQSEMVEEYAQDHPLEQVIRNPSQSVRTRRQLESNEEMCMFALTVSRTELKNIKEAMADSAWIESMQEELHQFDRSDV
nr:Gag-Pol polyprotein [Tanacetum cinerariifolium]